MENTNPTKETPKKSNKLWIILVIILLLIIGGGIFWYLISKNSIQESRSSEDQNSQPISQQEYLIALGDEFSLAAAMSSGMSHENVDYNFSTGTKIDSVYKYLKNTLNQNIEYKNTAKNGATSSDVLNTQIPILKSEDYENTSIITLFVGANDVVKNDWAKLSSTFETNLDKIAKEVTNTNAKTFIVNMPNFVSMPREDNSSCKTNQYDKEGRMSMASMAYVNDLISKTAEKYNLVLVDIYNLMEPSDLSTYDCFHLNQNGQKKLAQELIKKYKEYMGAVPQ